VSQGLPKRPWIGTAHWLWYLEHVMPTLLTVLPMPMHRHSDAKHHQVDASA